MTTYHLVKKSNLYKMLSKICTVVSDDCLLHETACNTKCIGKLVLIIVKVKCLELELFQLCIASLMGSIYVLIFHELWSTFD